MIRKRIAFTAPETAELLPDDITAQSELGPKGVMVKTAYSTISAGTERANVSGNLSVGWRTPALKEAVFPRYGGYSSSGVVIKVGSDVKKVKVGDRVAVCWGNHTDINIVSENNVHLVPDEVTLSEATLCNIASFPLEAMRKTRLEFGESAIIMGLGILGCFAVQFCRAAGAYPVIAVDPTESRREYAEKLGADYTLDPFAPDFVEKMKSLTGGGARVAIEVTGSGKALNQVLDCMAPFGRVALLGCTRDSNFTIDYYRKVHGPGITLIGAHTEARPTFESSGGFWTAADDIRAVLNMAKGKRINLGIMINERRKPEECGEVYKRLCHDKDFPLGLQFVWDESLGK